MYCVETSQLTNLKFIIFSASEMRSPPINTQTKVMNSTVEVDFLSLSNLWVIQDHCGGFTSLIKEHLPHFRSSLLKKGF